MFSAVVVTHNEGDWLSRTVAGLVAGLPPDGEVIVVDDGSTDGSAEGLERGPVRVVRPETRLGIARARNLGAAWARGQTLLFSDAHMDVPCDYAAQLRSALTETCVGAVGPAVADVDQPSAIGYGFRWIDPTLRIEWLNAPGSAPCRVPMLGGCFVAIRREVFQAIGGFDPGLRIFGLDDAELSLRLWTAGYECRVLPELVVRHKFRARQPYAVPTDAMLHNMLRVGLVHFNAERLGRLVARLGSHAAFPAAFVQVVESDTWGRRDRVRADRRHDDEWFFRRFGMDW